MNTDHRHRPEGRTVAQPPFGETHWLHSHLLVPRLSRGAVQNEDLSGIYRWTKIGIQVFTMSELG